MYYSSVWPGAYSFKSEIKLFIQYLKKQFDALLVRIEKVESQLD